MSWSQMEQVETSIQQKLESLSAFPSNKCIYNVPMDIRKVKEECYRPLVVSIGPVYYRNPPVEAMQEMKMRHLECFLKDSREFQTKQGYMNKIREWEDEARGYYEGNIDLSTDEFIEMVLLDASFIVYLFMWHFGLVRDCPMQDRQELMPYIERDLFLEENQLPYFILKGLFEAAYGCIYSCPFSDLTCCFIANRSIPGSMAAGTEALRDILWQNNNIKHLVDFLRLCCLPSQLREKQLTDTSERAGTEFSLTASELKATGVKFRASKSMKLLDISFREGVLEIPRFVIQDSTEPIFRNLLFFEQSQYQIDSYFLDYMIFLDALINTPTDVQILVESGIIAHGQGDDESLVHMFDNVTKQFIMNTDRFYFARVSKDLNAYARQPRNRWMTILRTDYFNHRWSITYVIYAVLILTVLQVNTGSK